MPATFSPATMDAEMDDARQLLATYFPAAPLRWFAADERGERRVDAFLAEADDTLRPYYVSSLRVDGCWVAEAVSEYCHIPYDPALVNAKPPGSEAVGVFVTTWPVYAPGATQARFAHRGAVRTALVVADHCALVDWDSRWLGTDDRPAPVALLIDGAWQPTVSRLVAATAAEFGRAYAAYHATKQAADDWTVEAFLDTGTFADKRRMVESVLDTPGVSDRCLGYLAAGPVEDLIGRELLDLLERDAAMRARWAPLLRGTYWSREPPDVRRRLRVLLGLPPEPG
jgi:hypothetical protein